MTVPDPHQSVMMMLERFGPETAEGDRPRVSRAEATAYCHALARAHYENFPVLTGLVPARLRDDFAAVYAFCRWSDDLGDETGRDEAARERSKSLLAWWRGELVRCFEHARGLGESEGEREGTAPTHPVFVALAGTFGRHEHLAAKPFDDLVSAFEQDQTVTRYETWEQLLDYCERSANPVGRIVLTLGGYAPPDVDAANAERYRLSDLTCSALQLINFWQDVRRDLIERDRVYLPSAETGISAEDLQAWLDAPGSLDPANRTRYIRAVRGLVKRTETMFDESRGLPEMLDPSIGPVVRLFAEGGRAVLRSVMRSGCTTLWRRPRLTKGVKAVLIARAWLGARSAASSDRGGKDRPRDGEPDTLSGGGGASTDAGERQTAALNTTRT